MWDKEENKTIFISKQNLLKLLDKELELSCDDKSPHEYRSAHSLCAIALAMRLNMIEE